MQRKFRSIMILGTASGVGKSLLNTALCRIFYQDGLRVSPFKAINISYNSTATADNKEIATSQAVQAKAANINPSCLMNPFLIKPQKGDYPQVILKGKVATSKQIENYYKKSQGLWLVVKKSFDKLANEYQMVVLEGAASPAEPGFIKDDIVNLKIAKYAKSSIILVSDIERGGVFASLEGTISILKRHDPEVTNLIKGIVINKYQGRKKDLILSCKELTSVTGIPVLGVIPFVEDHGIADEDTWFLKDNRGTKDALLDIAIIKTPSLQNSTDFDQLISEPGVNVRFISKVSDFNQPNLVILAGSKNTVLDLLWLQRQGFGELILESAKNGRALVGICGGFQMLGKFILDPHQVESKRSKTRGLGLLPVVTTYGLKKTVKKTTAIVNSNVGLVENAFKMKVSGYEIHMGQTKINGKVIKGVVGSEDGWILGTYLHDIFANDHFRTLILKNLAKRAGVILERKEKREKRKDKYDSLAAIVRKNLKMKLLYKILDVNTSQV